MDKLVLYYNFILVSIMCVFGFLAAASTAQLVSAILFFPLALYFLLLVLPKKRKAILVPIVKKKEQQQAEEGVVLEKQDLDKDRRMFLKLIGSAGLTVFFFSIFTKKAQAAFFGSVPGPGTVALKDSGGNQIDPAVKQPTDGYKVTEIDDAGANTYVGFVDKGGAWYIQRDDGSSYRYVKGASGFATNWTNRTSLTYDYFDAVF